MPQGVIAGRYRFEREVGRGGMGSVWLCRDERLGRDVAVKQVGGLPGESSMHLARALREARHSAALNHPNVVAIYDALEEGDHVWLVMEYVPSRTLDQMVREDGPLAPARVASICADVADGLAAAHALGTVHRDVKPSNILVREADDRALIADFGIARTVGQEQLTRSGLVTGTPVYFAPELARGEEPSPASDVWALGVSVYVAVEGRPPYPDQSNAIALLNTIASEPLPEPTRAGSLGPALERMLDPDPGARWTMAQAADELRRLASPASDSTPTRLFTDPTPTPTRERPVAAAVAAAAEPTRERPARAAAAAPMTADPPPAADEVPWSEPADGRRRRLPALLAVAAVTLLAVALVGGWWLTRDTDDPGTATDQTPSDGNGAGTPTREPSPEPSDQGAQESEDSEPAETSEPPPTQDPEPSTSTTAGASTGSRTDLVTEYYSLLPEDLDTSWQLYSPELQNRIGRDSFVGFWTTIDDVSVDSVQELDDGLVEVTITYVKGGTAEQETRQLEVTPSGGGMLITDDLGAVSAG